MKNIAICFAALFALQLNSDAYAVPTGYYNPATGAIFLTNDTGADLAHITIRSAGGHFRTDPALYAAFPGATFDPTDLPVEFTYLSFPPTGLLFPESFVGSVVIPGTLGSDLSGFYRSSPFDSPQRVDFIWAEPTSSALGLMGAIAFTGLSRRFRT